MICSILSISVNVRAKCAYAKLRHHWLFFGFRVVCCSFEGISTCVNTIHVWPAGTLGHTLRQSEVCFASNLPWLLGGSYHQYQPKNQSQTPLRCRAMIKFFSEFPIVLLNMWPAVICIICINALSAYRTQQLCNDGCLMVHGSQGWLSIIMFDIIRLHMHMV